MTKWWRGYLSRADRAPNRQGINVATGGSAEVVHQHDVAVVTVKVLVDDPAAVG